MSIQIHTKPQGAVFSFNETRLEKVLTAKTQREAEAMGVFDKIRDVFRGSPKLTAIRELYNSLANPAPHDNAPVDMLGRFHRLRNFAEPGQRDQFKVVFNAPDDTARWGYTLNVSGQPICQSPPDMVNAPGSGVDAKSDFEKFHEALQTDSLLAQTQVFAKECQQAGNLVLDGRDRAAYARGAVDFVTDDPAVRLHIKDNLDNPLYSLENFQGFASTGDPHSFEAIFESNDQRTVLVLSDRAPNQGEFRGEVLKQALQGNSGSYRHLGELFGADFETSADRHINAFYRPMLAKMTDQFNVDSGSALNSQQICEKLLALPQHDPIVAGHIFVELSGVKLGQTNLLNVLFKEAVPTVETQTHLASMIHCLEQPEANTWDMVEQSAWLGAQLIQETNPAVSQEATQLMVSSLSDHMVAQLPTERLLHLYAAFMANPQLIMLEQSVLGINIRADDGNPFNPGTPEEREYLVGIVKATQPFQRGFMGLLCLFESVKTELRQREVGDGVVMSDDDERKMFDQLNISVDRIGDAIFAAVTSSAPLPQMLAQMRSDLAQPDLPPTHAVWG